MSTQIDGPSSRPTDIHDLLTGVQRYNPSNAVLLEDYLSRQCSNPDPTTNHDLTANLALLKLYQFNPEIIDTDVIRRILAKALISSTAGDFNLCLYLLSDEICQDPSVAKLLALRDLLERAEFAGFWKEMYGEDTEDEEASVVDGIAGFDSGVRKLIIGEIANTYQTAPAQSVGQMVNLDQEAVLKLAQDHQWQVKEGVISLPLKTENQAKTTLISENTRFEQLTKLISASTEV